MTSEDYNLLDEPWIPVRTRDGGVEKLGVKEVFLRADEIEDLAAELPTQNAALLRFLLTISYRVVPLDGRAAWDRMWSVGLPTDDILAYLEQWRDRFFLFGGNRPFMQTPGLEYVSGKTSGLEMIIADVPNGEPFLTTRSGQHLARIPADEAAIWLLHAHAYDPSGIRGGAKGDPEVKGGKGYPTGPAWCGHLGLVILLGDSLEETLMLNMVPRGVGGLREVAPQAPTWESENPESSSRRDFSLLDERGDPDPSGIDIPRILSWHSRRVRLAGDRTGVTGVILAQGDKLSPQNMHLYEPMSLWRYSEPQSRKFKRDVYMARKHEAGRALWRSLPAFLPSTGKVDGRSGSPIDATLPSATLAFHSLSAQMTGREFPVLLRVRAVGVTYGPQEATFEEVYADEMTLASAVLQKDSPELAHLVEVAVERTEAVESRLEFFAVNIARASGQSGKDAGDGDRRRAREEFFARIDDLFRRWLRGVVPGTDATRLRDDWFHQLRECAFELADELVRVIPRTALVPRPGVDERSLSVADAERILRKQILELTRIAKEEEGTR